MSIHLEQDSEDGLTVELKAFGPADCQRVDLALGFALPQPAKVVRHAWSNGKTYSFFKADCPTVQSWLHKPRTRATVRRRPTPTTTRPAPTPPPAWVQVGSAGSQEPKPAA